MSSNTADFEVRLDDGVSGPAKKAAGGFRELLNSLRGAGEAGGGVSRMLEFATGGLIENAIEKIAELGKAALETGLEFAKFAQNSEMAFGLLAHHGHTGEELFGTARKLAVDLGLDMQETTHAFERFLKLQFAPEKAVELVKLGADLRAVGTDAQQVQSIFLAMGQIKSLGKLQGQDLMQLAQAGVSTELVYKKLSEQLGVTTEQVIKMQSAGQIGADAALNAIKGAILVKTNTTAPGEAAKKFADSTLEGMAGKAKAQFDNILTTIGSMVAPLLGTGFSAVMDGFRAGLEPLMPMLTTLGKGLLDAFQDPGTIAAIKSTAGFLAKWAGVIGILTMGILRLIPPIIQVVGWFAGIGSAALSLIAIFDGSLTMAFSAQLDLIQSVLSAVTQFGQSMFQVGTDFVDGFIGGITGGISRAAQAAADMAHAAWQSAKDVLGISSPSKEMKRIGGFTAEGFGLGIADSLPNVTTAANDMAGAAMPSIPNAAASIGGGGGPSLSRSASVVINLTVEAPAGGTKADGERFASGMIPPLRRELNSWAEDLALTG